MLPTGVDITVLEASCERAIQKITAMLDPPIQVEDFLAHQILIKLMGDVPQIQLTKDLAQTSLTPFWLAEFVLKSKNISLMVAIVRLAGNANGDTNLSEKNTTEISELESTHALLHQELQNVQHEQQQSTIDLKAIQQKNKTLEAQVESVHSMEAQMNSLKQENEELRAQLNHVLGEFGLRNDADQTLRDLHQETDRLHYRLSKQKKQVMQPIQHLKEDNNRLAENFAVERRSSMKHISRVAELEMALGSRDATIDSLNAQLRNVKGERDKMLQFTVDALGKKQLKDALNSGKVRLSWAKSRMSGIDD